MAALVQGSEAGLHKQQDDVLNAYRERFESRSVRGANPRGWLADVAYVPSSENRSHGASLGAKLRRYCNGVKFRYVFT